MNNQIEVISLISVDQSNSFLGNTLQSTSEQIQKKLTLSVPNAIKEAFEVPCAEPYFICLADKIVGYAALVFDEEISEPDKRYWLWQFMIDKKYQNKGYTSKALEQIIENHFKKKNVKVITLSTKPDNYPALELYKKFGFNETGEMNEDEIILQKYLKNDYS